MPIKREYKCQIIFQTAANVTQIAKKKNKIKQPEKKKQKIKQIKVTAIKAIPTVDPKIAWKKSEKEETTFLAEYALYWKKQNLLF